MLRGSFETRVQIGGCSLPVRSTAPPAEEAAAQGPFAAGSTPRCKCRGDGLAARRDEAYLGVLIDDLVTQGVTEPHCMFTSRAEFRLQLRGQRRQVSTGNRPAGPGGRCTLTPSPQRDAVSRETERLKSTWVNLRNPSASESERAGQGHQNTNTIC